MIEIADQCRNRWPSILPMFGVGSALLDGKHHPCPLCGGKDRFRFTDKDRNGWTICNQCGRRDGVKLVMELTGKSFPEACAAIRERLGETHEAPAARTMDPRRARAASGGLWSGAAPIFGDDAAIYLASRGLPGPYPAALRFCRAARVSDHPTKTVLPAILALVSDPRGLPANVHRTYLEDGQKANIPAPRKMMSGEVPEGSAIRLGAHDGRLGIAEGIETALAVTLRFGITCWSAIDAGKMATFAIPADVRELHIFGDNDHNFAGQKAAFTLAHRAAVQRNGPKVPHPFIPDKPGTDWADYAPLERAA